MSSAISSPAGGYTDLLRRPGYPGFVATVSLSRVVANMFIVSGVLLVLVRTHSPALAGATAAAGTITWAISAPVLGAILEVARRRRVLIVVDQLVSVGALLGLVALAGHAPGWTLPLDAVLLNSTRAFSTSSFFSTLNEVAGHDLLDRASNIEATSLNLSFVLGPALAGILAGAFGPATAIYIQAAATALVALLIALNPAFELRAAERAERALHALRDGFLALRRDMILRRVGTASMLAMFGWGLMALGFPLYAARYLHAGAHASGYLWGSLALGSAVGTFALAGRPSLRRVGASYAVLGLSALLWPLGGALLAGVLLVGLTGFLEGPAYSGTVALRQRHATPALRAAQMSALNGFTLAANAAGSGVAALLGTPGGIILAFTVVNLLAALVAGAGRSRSTGR